MIIDDKKIEEAAQTYALENASEYEDQMGDMISNEPDLLDSFSKGAHWAIDEFLKDLWHPASEEPDIRHRIIMCLYKEGDICQDNDVYDEATEHDRHKLRIGEFDWVGYAEENNIEKWCYKDDLLPRKGE